MGSRELSRLKTPSNLAALAIVLSLLLPAIPYSTAILPPTLNVVGVYWGNSPDRTIQASPGDYNAPLSVVVQNNNVTDVFGIEARLDLASTPFTNTLGERVAITNVPGVTVRMGAQTTLVFNLNIAPEAELRIYKVPMTFFYKAPYGREALNLSVPVPLLGRVQLLYASNVKFLPIGNGTYGLTVSNMGTTAARSLVASVSFPSTLAVIGGSPSLSVASLAPSESASTTVSIYAPDKAAGTSYRLSVTSSYVDAYGYTRTESGGLDLVIVKTEVQATLLTISLDQPEATVGSRIRLYGTLSRRDTGAGLAGAKVELEIVDPELNVEVRSFVTNPYGQWEEVLIPSKVGTYAVVVRFKGGAFPEAPWTIYTPSSAQATIKATKVTEITCPLPWQVALPGGQVVFSLQIKNKGSRAEKYFLNLKGVPADWDFRFHSEGAEVKAVEVQPLQAVGLTLTLRVPETALDSLLDLRLEAKGDVAVYSYALAVSVEKPLRLISLNAPFLSLTTLTGGSLAYPLEVVNKGDRAEQVYLYTNRTASTMDWRFAFTLDGKAVESISLPPGGRQWVSLTVTPPYLAKVGPYPINVFVATADAQFNASRQLTAIVVGLYRLELTFNPLNPEAVTGEAAEVSVSIRNTGQSPVTGLRLNITADASLTVSTIPLDVLSLAPNEKIAFLLRISPRLDATPGAYVVTVQAVSREGSFDRRDIPVTVKTAIPWHLIEIAITAVAVAAGTVALERLLSKLRIRLARK